MLRALQERLLQQDLFDEFCDEFTREMNRLRMERRASISYAKREVERIGTRIRKLLNFMLDDEVAVEEGKAEIKALDDRRKGLQAQLKTADEPPPLLQAEMARTVSPEGDDPGDPGSRHERGLKGFGRIVRSTTQGPSTSGPSQCQQRMGGHHASDVVHLSRRLARRQRRDRPGLRGRQPQPGTG